jgi:hypothetical protein
VTALWVSTGLRATTRSENISMYRLGVLEMRQLRLTHNAALGYQRRLAPDQSISGAYYQLKRACAGGRYEQRPPEWLRKSRGQADGYMVLDGEVAALPVRNGRVIACLVNPLHADR